MTNETLREQVSRIQPGDEVEAAHRLYGFERLPVSGEVWEDRGVLYVGSSRLRYPNGEPAVELARIVSHTPKRRRIVRGDVIASRDDVERFEIPPKTVFRDRAGDARTEILGSLSWFGDYAPFRCVDVLADGES